MDRVHDYESCDIGSIPIMSDFCPYSSMDRTWLF